MKFAISDHIGTKLPESIEEIAQPKLGRQIGVLRLERAEESHVQLYIGSINQNCLS